MPGTATVDCAATIVWQGHMIDPSMWCLEVQCDPVSWLYHLLTCFPHVRRWTEGMMIHEVDRLMKTIKISLSLGWGFMASWVTTCLSVYHSTLLAIKPDELRAWNSTGIVQYRYKWKSKVMFSIWYWIEQAHHESSNLWQFEASPTCTNFLTFYQQFFMVF